MAISEQDADIEMARRFYLLVGELTSPSSGVHVNEAFVQEHMRQMKQATEGKPML